MLYVPGIGNHTPGFAYETFREENVTPPPFPWSSPPWIRKGGLKAPQKIFTKKNRQDLELLAVLSWSN